MALNFSQRKGTKLPDEIEDAIEQAMEQDLCCVDSAQLGKASRIDDAPGRYIEFCKSTFPSELSLDGSKSLWTVRMAQLSHCTFCI